MAEPVVVSYSELDTYRQCPLKHHLAYKLRYTKPTQSGGALSRGTLWHKVMENHYKVLTDHIQRDAAHSGDLDNLWQASLPLLYDDHGHQTDDQQLIEWMYRGYLENYGGDMGWYPLAVERKFEVPLPGPTGRPSRYRLKMRIDLVVLDQTTGGIWVVDHKSGADLPNSMALEIDDQFGLYQWGLRQLRRSGQFGGDLDPGLNMPDYPLMGTIHNGARTRRNQGDYPGGKGKPQGMDQRFRRTYLNRSDVELDSLAYDAYCAAYNAHPPRSKTRPLYSSPDPRTCSWKCDFKEAHIAARTGRNIEEAAQEFGFTQDFTRH